MTYGVETAQSVDHDHLNADVPLPNGRPASSPRQTTEEPQRHTATDASPTHHLADCLDAAVDLAVLLNHPQVNIVHVIVAMALDPNGRNGLHNNQIDFHIAHANGLENLFKITPICPRLSPEQMAETEELLRVRDAAIAIANRRDPQQRTISIDDFVKAFLDKASPETHQICKEQQDAAPGQDPFNEWQHRVEGSLKRIEEAHTKPDPQPANDNDQTRRFARVAGLAGVVAASVAVTFFVFVAH